MTYENALILSYVGFAAILMYAAFQVDTSKNKLMSVLQIWLFVAAFLMMLNGLTTSQDILHQQNYTSPAINETVYAAISSKQSTTYSTVLWTFVFMILWLFIMMIWSAINMLTDKGGKNS